MGLHQRNASRTREVILDAALQLFVEHGFEATTMERVAQAADVSPSTLYRYFPTKELLVTEPLELRGQMAAEVLARPASEPLDAALGHALVVLITTPRLDPERMAQLSTVLGSAPGPLARLREDFVQERVLLEQAIARRTGRSVSDPFCLMTARLATSLLEIVGGREYPAPHHDAPAADAVEFVRSMLDQLRTDAPVMARL